MTDREVYPTRRLPFRQAIFITQDRIEVRGAEAGGEEVELVLVVIVAVMQMGSLGDQPQVGYESNAVTAKDATEWFEIPSIDEYELVFVQLDFHSTSCTNDRNTSTTVVQQQILKVAEMTHEDRQVDIPSPKVGVVIAIVAVAGLKHRVDTRSQRFQQVEEHIEQLFS